MANSLRDRAMAPPKHWPDHDIHYLSHLTFNSTVARYLTRQQCRLAQYFNRLPEKAQWLGALYSDEIQQGHIANIGIEYIDKTLGHGVFAKQALAAGEFIGVYTGVVRCRRAFYQTATDYSFTYPQILPSFYWLAIDAEDSGNETRYINHSDQPNCEAVRALWDNIFYIIVRTHQPIARGEQLFFNYGPEYWRKRDTPSEIK